MQNYYELNSKLNIKYFVIILRKRDLLDILADLLEKIKIKKEFIFHKPNITIMNFLKFDFRNSDN